MSLNAKHELFLWITGGVAAIAAFLLSHTSFVSAATYRYGLALFSIVALLFWLKFRRRIEPAPTWLRMTANSILAVLCMIVTLYLLGVATWYK
ncbi:MAG: hypothetical protein L0Z53_28060 [Acidobacteriales bacterium]|nr:hypothetical protein [Terriglobales bacterium]